jgi:hypothetical protein
VKVRQFFILRLSLGSSDGRAENSDDENNDRSAFYTHENLSQSSGSDSITLIGGVLQNQSYR